MKYLKIENDFIQLSKFNKELVSLLVEVDNGGIIKKEIGLNKQNQIVHVFPSKKYEFGKYGIFDLNQFDLSGIEDDISFEMFYGYWNRF